MRKNVKVIASLVRKAKKKLNQGKRDEALELMKKAVDVDDNNGVLFQIIQVIGKKKSESEYEEEPADIPVEPPEEEQFEILEFTPEEMLVDQETEPDEKIFEILEYTREETSVDQRTKPAETAIENNQERKSSMTSEDRLIKIFEASDKEYENGHQQKAIAYLKRGQKLYPDNPEIQSKIDLLKTNIKSANLVQIARKKLKSGEVAEAVVLARRIFKMMPETNGLSELLFAIENESGSGNDIDVEEYISQIRQLVQDNLLEKAAWFAEKSFRLHPNDKLLMEFIDNFKKLGLIE